MILSFAPVAVGVAELMERGGMVHLAKVGKFVVDYIVGQIKWQKYEPRTQRDNAV